MSELKTVLFADKFRSAITSILLVIIMVLVLLSWLFPKQHSVSSETLTTLENVAKQMERVGNNIERAATSQEHRNELLEADLKLRAKQRSADYGGLYGKYGTYQDDRVVADGFTPDSLQLPAIDERSGHLSKSPVRTDKN